MHLSTLAAVLVILGCSSVFAAPADTANSTDTISLGPFNILKPVLKLALGEKTLLTIQTNVSNLIAAVRARDISRFFYVVLGIVDPSNIIVDSFEVLNNYQSNMYDPKFRQSIGGMVRGIAKVVVSFVRCIEQNIEGKLNDLTSAYVDALNNAFLNTRPNSTSPPTGLLAVPSTAINTFKLVIDMLASPPLREAVAEAIKSTVSGFRGCAVCAQQNATDLVKSWQAMSAILTNTSAPVSTSVATAAPTAAPKLLQPVSTSAPVTTAAPTVAPKVSTSAPVTTAAPTAAPVSTSAPTTTAASTAAPIIIVTEAPTTTTTKRSKFLGIF